MSGHIDIVVNVLTPQEIRENRNPTDDRFHDQVRNSQDVRKGVTIPDYIAKMDRAGIERSLLIAVRCGDLRIRGSMEITYERVHEICQAYPHRFSGLAGIDPTRGVAGLKELDKAVHEYGFVGAHLYPHWFGLAPDAAQYYPYYARCVELDIPIMMQVGHNLIYQKDRRLPSVGRPICLDQVAIDFPDLKLVGIHLGVPWTDEMISMAWKHENIYIGGDAYAPRYWPKQMVHYANTYGSHKFLFGTDWPVIEPETAVSQVNELGFRPDSYRKIMRDNAMKLFKLPGHEAVALAAE
jgi:predicted TIM-barrel fold metal-dependent hydrolase